MFELHEILKDSIKQNFDLLINFLNDYDFNCFNPMQDYVNSNAEEICNSWILPKVNFEKLNMSCFLKNNKIPKIFRNFLINDDAENKFNKYTIEKSLTYDLDKKILKQNSLFLEKLTLEKIINNSEMEKIFSNEEIEKLNFKKMKTLKLVKCTLDYLVNLNGFKNINKLEAHKSFFSDLNSNMNESNNNAFASNSNNKTNTSNNNNNPARTSINNILNINNVGNNNISMNETLGNMNNSNNNFFQNFLSENFSNLKKINLRRCFINNDTVLFLMSEFEKLNFLERIDLSNNDITMFNYRGQKCFKSLNTLILRKNKITKFYLKNTNIYPCLKVVDFSSNNIVDLIQVKELLDNNILILLGRNLGLYNNVTDYREYLISIKKILAGVENKLKKLDLSYLYYSFNNLDEFHIKNICLNKILLFNIKKFDMSFNNLHDEDFTEFFSTNRGFVNVKEIKLRNNRLTESFFDKLIELDLNDFYEYLEKIDLANNNIHHNCLEGIFTAFHDNQNLKEISLKNNPIENNFYLFFCRRLENKQKYDRFITFFSNLEKMRQEKRKCHIILSYNTDLLQYFSTEAKDFSSKFIKFEK